jgi:hypothetical protein
MFAQLAAPQQGVADLDKLDLPKKVGTHVPTFFNLLNTQSHLQRSDLSKYGTNTL